MHGWLHRNQFCKTYKNCFCPRCLRCMMAFAGAFTTKQHPKTWTKTVLIYFTKMIAEQPSLTQYERPMYHYERKNAIIHCHLITIWWIFFSILRDLRLNLGFLFLTHPVKPIVIHTGTTWKRYTEEIYSLIALYIVVHIFKKRKSLQILIIIFKRKTRDSLSTNGDH